MLDSELLRERNHLESVISQCFDRLDSLAIEAANDSLVRAQCSDIWRQIETADQRVQEIENSLPLSILETF